MEIGAKIKRLRLQRGLTQEELADRCELSKGFISQVERDLTSPSIASLTDILECLGTDLPSFFSDPREEKIVFTEDDIYVKEDPDGLKGCIKWLVPSAQKNVMEPILVELGPGGATAATAGRRPAYGFFPASLRLIREIPKKIARNRRIPPGGTESVF